MKDKLEDNSATKPEDYLVAMLLDYFRHPKASKNFLHAAKLAHSVLTRDSATKAAILEKRFLFFASKLKDNIAPNTLRDFAEKCFAAAKKDPRTERVSLSPGLKTLTKRAKEDLMVSLQMGHLEGAAVNRAAYELVRTRRKEMAKLKVAEAVRTHPMRDTLQGLMTHENRLAREDIRNQFLRLRRQTSERNANAGVLFGLLEKAQAFSAPRLHRLLGDDLFFLCRPCGFLDQKGGTVVIEVPTNAHLHALTYRKLEILRALKNDTAFLLVNKLHFKVVTTAF